MWKRGKGLSTLQQAQVGARGTHMRVDSKGA